MDTCFARVLLMNERGLHARAAARLVKMAETFDAEVTVCHNGQEVSALSILSLLMLSAQRGQEITLKAIGSQAQESLNALVDLASHGFGDGI